MKLLIFTQKVDLDDTVLSFFHRWITGLATHFEVITIVCLYEGRHELPANVKVFSLGKENKRSRISYVLRFFRYAITFRNIYDVVFTHQNQEYVILGGLLWKILGKKVFMWRNHYAGSMLTDIASVFCTNVFCTSKYSYTAKYKKTIFMPVGVDTEIFCAPDGRDFHRPHSILSLGRIAPSKKLEQLVEALAMVRHGDIGFSASFYGDALERDKQYLESLKSKVLELGITDINFYPGVSNDKTPGIYSEHGIFVNMSPSGMFDKTIFEAMSCGTIAISCNENLVGKIDPAYLFKANDIADLAHKIEAALLFTAEDRNARGLQLRKFAIENHGLSLLCSRLAESMS